MRARHLLAVLLGSIAACEQSAPVNPIVPAPEPIGVRAYVVEEPGGTPDRITLTIHVRGQGVDVAAYQGRLEYAADAMEILESSAPGDGTRLVNPKAGAGIVRFAGFSTATFASTAAATLVVHPLKPLAQANLVTSLQIAGRSSGSAVSKSLLVPQAGLLSAAAVR